LTNCIITPRRCNPGIDTSNVLANSPSLPYTAIQDCYVSSYFAQSDSGTIDDKIIMGIAHSTMPNGVGHITVILKKGQKFSGGSGAVIYGIKY